MTQREYAAHRGVSQPAVSKAIKTGRIQLEPDGRIDPVKADAAWKRNTDPEKQANGHTGGVKAQKHPSTRAPTPTQPSAPSTPAPASARARTASDPDEDASPKIDYNRARTVRETFAAKIAELEYKERAGLFVPADQVKVGIFKVMTILKTHIMGIHSKCRLQSDIPPRVVDLIDTLCRSGLEEASRALEELANGKV